MSASISISCWSGLKFLYLECVIMYPVHLNQVLTDGPQLLATETCRRMCLYKQRLQTSPLERALTACDTASMEQPASVTKSSVGQAGFLKRENKTLCRLLTQKIITSALGQPFCIIQQVGRTVPDAGGGLCQIRIHHMLLAHC